MKPVLALCLFALLAACGADGDPIRPEPRKTVEPGLTVTGSAEVGIVKR